MVSDKTSSVLQSIVVALVLVMLTGLSNSDLAQDRAECTDQLVSLSACLPYANGDAAVPTQVCCSGLKLVLQKSLKCLCILIRDRNDPNLGIKVNTTLALSLPSSCHSPVNISKCIDILGLAPNSDNAKVFLGFEKSLETKNSTQASNMDGNSASSEGSSAKVMSDCEQPKPLLALRYFFGALIWISTWEFFLAL